MNNIVIGYKSDSRLFKNVILIGDEITADRDFQFTIKTGKVFINTTLTYQEWERMVFPFQELLNSISERFPRGYGFNDFEDQT